MKLIQVIGITCLIITSFNQSMYSHTPLLIKKNSVTGLYDTLQMPAFTIDQKEVSGTFAYYVLTLDEYTINNQKLSVLVTSTIDLANDSSIQMTLKGCYGKNDYGPTFDVSHENYSAMFEVLEHYAFDIEYDIVNRLDIQSGKRDKSFMLMVCILIFTLNSFLLFFSWKVGKRLSKEQPEVPDLEQRIKGFKYTKIITLGTAFFLLIGNTLYFGPHYGFLNSLVIFTVLGMISAFVAVMAAQVNFPVFKSKKPLEEIG